ncbi:MAG: histidinol-phosphatase HisJ [Armatimonadetes bacterium]|nr:histidinol-phosphatase HisJ [Armatimonadota bacterium]
MAAVRFDPWFDGHTHSHFCPHGSREPLRGYLDRAVELGLRRLAITEHIPAPDGFIDPMGPGECYGPIADLDPYLAECEALRDEYADRVEVLIGLEIDWLGDAQGGWHEPLLDILARVWPRLDHEATLLSVHFLADTAVDGTAALSMRIAPGEPADAYHLAYYAALRRALDASWTRDGQDLRPRRVGHLTLPRKFVRALPLTDPERVWAAALATVDHIAREGLQLDVNAAGLDKPDCGELYVPEPLLGRAIELGVELVFGSDAHAPRGVGKHLDLVEAAIAAHTS